jgi:hypothetical protein
MLYFVGVIRYAIPAKRCAISVPYDNLNQ